MLKSRLLVSFQHLKSMLGQSAHDLLLSGHSQKEGLFALSQTVPELGDSLQERASSPPTA